MRKKIFSRILLSCIGVFFTLSAAFAQSKTITGTVRDDKGSVLPGATVMVKGEKITTTTGQDGSFSISFPAHARSLIISFIGMQEQTVEPGKKTNLDISLKSSSSVLGDVVVIGYGTQRKQDVNGAISSVTAKDIANVPMPSIDQLLQGRAAGVTVTQNSGTPGSATSVHIRGVTSFGSSEPLYVIDGVAVQGDASNSSTSGKSVQLTRTGGGQEETAVSPLANINPGDIESVDILKDASATAIYGSRGANGVIIITTKKGRLGASRLNYDGYYGTQQQGKFLKMMDLPQYANIENAIADAFHTQKRAEFANPPILGKGTDWQHEIFRTAPQQSHQLSVSGGKNGVDYYLSGGYFKQDGTIIGSDFKRYTFRSNVNAQVKDWFKLGGILSGSRSWQNIGLADNTGVVYNALLSAPDIPVYNADGSFAGPSLGPGGLVQGTVNPVAQASVITNNLNRSNLNGTLYADLNFLKDFSLRTEVNGDFNWAQAMTFTPTYQWGPIGNQTARLEEYNTSSTYWSWKEYLNYNHTFGGVHAVTALAGHEVWASYWDGTDNKIQNFASGNQIPLLQFGS
ncbi:MAG TPA: SusC/RagA family TonB-linked outer membrane protein, partial [Puia sp.]